MCFHVFHVLSFFYVFRVFYMFHVFMWLSCAFMCLMWFSYPLKLRGGDVQKCNLHFPMFSDLKNVSLHFSFVIGKCKISMLTYVEVCKQHQTALFLFSLCFILLLLCLCIAFAYCSAMLSGAQPSKHLKTPKHAASLICQQHLRDDMIHLPDELPK